MGEKPSALQAATRTADFSAGSRSSCHLLGGAPSPARTLCGFSHGEGESRAKSFPAIWIGTLRSTDTRYNKRMNPTTTTVRTIYGTRCPAILGPTAALAGRAVAGAGSSG